MKPRLANCTLVFLSMVVLFLVAPVIPLYSRVTPTSVRYEGRWEVQPNGDIRVSRLYKLPMRLYRKWRNTDMHMLEFRNLASERSPIEVADKNAEWNDMDRTLKLTMTILGMAKNMGDHWEVNVVPGEEFSNFNEAKKIGYFHFSFDGPMGRIQGQDQIILPQQSSEHAWNASARTIKYDMPEPEIEGDGSLTALWWILFVVCLLAGLSMLAASYTTRFKTAKL